MEKCKAEVTFIQYISLDWVLLEVPHLSIFTNKNKYLYVLGANLVKVFEKRIAVILIKFKPLIKL